MRKHNLGTCIGLLIGLIVMIGSCSNPRERPPSTGTTPAPSTNNNAVITRGRDNTNTNASTNQTQNVPIATSSKPRIADPQINATDLDTLVADNTAFMSDLYRNWAASNSSDNLIFSPYSISSAHAMLYAGSSTNTATEISSVFHFSLPSEVLHTGFNALSLALNSRGKGALGVGVGRPFRLEINNALWSQIDKTWLPTYLDILATDYGSGVYLVDYLNSPETARITINDWVAQKTENKITDLLAQGTVNDSTKAILINTVFFEAAWATPFPPDQTATGQFTLLDGSTVNTPTMHRTSSEFYLKTNEFDAIELTYSGNELAALIVMPVSGQFAAFEARLNQNDPLAFFSAAERFDVDLSMPSFKLKTNLNLKLNLLSMGLHDVFDPLQADLSGMDGTRELFVTNVLHQAFAEVSEAGTVASAATAVIVGAGGGGSYPPANLVIDRPFFFFIRDIQTGTVLFTGRVLDPTRI